MDCRQPKQGAWYTDSPTWAWKHARWSWDDIDKKNPKFSRLRDSPEFSNRCVLHQFFEPSILQVVENFMHRNVARSLNGRRMEEFDSNAAPRSTSLARTLSGE
jgi:hypothetical protein